jgi:Fe-S oxidoreductase
MPLPTGDVIGILADNLRLRGSVLPIGARRATRWARTLHLPRGGTTVLYTGQMYQLIPFIEGLVKVEEAVQDTWLTRLAGFGRRVNKLIGIAGFMVHPRAAERAQYDEVLVDVVSLLRAAGVEFGYLYEDDLYTGALVHDLGVEDVVLNHARRVQAVLRAHGVRELITVDPHTTNMLRSVYPSILDDFDVKVRSYLEVLAERKPIARRDLAATLAIHDSCVYARYEGVIDQPRALLRGAGVTVQEVENAGLLTWCCGGPVESLYPSKATAVATARVEQLRAAAAECVTMCPLCLVNLQKAAGDSLQLTDISHHLRKAYAD